MSRRTRKTRKQVPYDWYNAICDMWSDVHSGRTTIDDLDVGIYQRRYNISREGKRHFVDIIMNEFLPTIEQTEEVRKSIMSGKNARKNTTEDVSEEPAGDVSADITEEEAIRFLLSTGKYVISKIIS